MFNPFKKSKCCEVRYDCFWRYKCTWHPDFSTAVLQCNHWSQLSSVMPDNTNKIYWYPIWTLQILQNDWNEISHLSLFITVFEHIMLKPTRQECLIKNISMYHVYYVHRHTLHCDPVSPLFSKQGQCLKMKPHVQVNDFRQVNHSSSQAFHLRDRTNGRMPILHCPGRFLMLWLKVLLTGNIMKEQTCRVKRRTYIYIYYLKLDTVHTYIHIEIYELATFSPIE